jgi:hypothetical protein
MKISFLSGADSSSNNVKESQRKSYPSNFLFDFSNTDMNDLASDQCEFNDFYKNEGSQIKKIERPQNPFHKNF